MSDAQRHRWRERLPAWDRDALCTQPYLHTVHALLAALPQQKFPDCEVLNALARAHALTNACGQPLRFVPAGAQRVSAADYERRVWQHGEVLTRQHNWHDLYNALAWLAFPRTKACINRLHIAELTRQRDHRRSRGRDTLTLFDEGGMMIACSAPALLELLRAMRWRELFVTHRAEVRAQMRFFVLGHAVHEQALCGYKGVVAHALCFTTPQAVLDGPVDALLAELDARAAQWLAVPGQIESPQSLQPVPIFGIPGWTPDNEAPAWYDDAQHFRSTRRGVPAASSPSA